MILPHCQAKNKCFLSINTVYIDHLYLGLVHTEFGEMMEMLETVGSHPGMSGGQHVSGLGRWE